MQLTAHFVEYLVVGSLSLPWLIPLLMRADRLRSFLTQFDKEWLVLILPAIYFLGMALDSLGHFITLPHRNIIRKRAKRRYGKRYGIESIEHATADVDLLAACPPLAQAAEVRTTRGRIARGAVTNAIVGALVWVPLATSDKVLQGHWVVDAALLAILVIVLLWHMWARWQRIAFRFELKAIAIIRRD